jgi:hypothetical protein
LSAELLLGDFADGEAIVIELFDPGLDVLSRGGWVGLSVGVRGAQQAQGESSPEREDRTASGSSTALEGSRLLGGFRVGDCECKSASGLSKEHSDRQWGWVDSQVWGASPGRVDSTFERRSEQRFLVGLRHRVARKLHRLLVATRA